MKYFLVLAVILVGCSWDEQDHPNVKHPYKTQPLGHGNQVIGYRVEIDGKVFILGVPGAGAAEEIEIPEPELEDRNG